MNWQVLTGDCLDLMRGMEAGSFDAVITDPPYGVGLDYATFSDTQNNVAKLAGDFVREARRLAPIVAFTPGIRAMWNYPAPSWVLSWNCPAGTGCGPWGFVCWHPVLVYGADPYLAGGKGSRPDSVTHQWTSDKTGHPCSKPVGFMRWLIQRVSLYGKVLDPFCGSGTTGVACAELGRDFVGIEIDPGYADIARKRIEAATRQTKLFTPEREAVAV